MRRVAGLTVTLVLLAVMAGLSLGCAVTNYPVIFDSRGPWGDSVMDSFYDAAYIVPTSQIATIYSDGSDELFTVLSQDWKGDQWLKTYNNFDSTATVLFLDQTYCDPNRQTDCAIWTAWNPDLPDSYPHGSSSDPGGGPGNNVTDDPFDGDLDDSCSGARSLSMLLSQTSRVGECGSGLWADKQASAFELSLLETTSFRGRDVYSIPVDSNIATFDLTDADGNVVRAPIYGRFQGYLDQDLRVAVPVGPNSRYQLRWLDHYIDQHGNYIDLHVTYGSLQADFKVRVEMVQNVLDRM
ncbi:MAG TPA: hypothetical protein ENK10_05160 [Acidobacteria bacterium]|nr:hypothetical protein [Acidobacteriota bacterium]